MSIAVLGAGSWGSAIALHLARNNVDTILWGRDRKVIKDIKVNRTNKKFLGDILFVPSLKVTANIAEALAYSESVIIAVPSHGFAEVLAMITKPLANISWLTKGIDPKSLQLLSELVKSKFGKNFPRAAISGPSFAKEVAQGLPTALTIATNSSYLANLLQTALHKDPLRIYTCSDLIGMQVCGAVKNVLAIACGISDGLGFGANTQALLITRGLKEISRLGETLGGSTETFYGLSGLGDLVLTCTDNQSRNRRFGLLLGQGVEQSDALAQIGQVVEGYTNAQQICELAKQHQIDMPICMQVSLLLSKKITAHQAASNLLKRPASQE